MRNIFLFAFWAVTIVVTAQTDKQLTQSGLNENEMKYENFSGSVNYLSLLSLAEDVEKTNDAIDVFLTKRYSINMRFDKSYATKDLRFYDNKIRLYSIGNGISGNYNFKFQQLYNTDLTTCISCGMGPLGPIKGGSSIGMGVGFWKNFGASVELQKR